MFCLIKYDFVCVCVMGRVLQDDEEQRLNLTRPEQQKVTDLPSVKKRL